MVVIATTAAISNAAQETRILNRIGAPGRSFWRTPCWRPRRVAYAVSGRPYPPQPMGCFALQGVRRNPSRVRDALGVSREATGTGSGPGFGEAYHGVVPGE